MRLYVKYIAFVTCFFLFWVCFLLTRFDALHVDIPNIASKLQNEAYAPLDNNNDPIVLEGSGKRAKLKVSEAGKARLRWHSPTTAIKFGNLSDSILFYSSFVDYRDGNMGYPYVRTILLKQMTHTVQLSCRFGETLVEGSLYELAENHLQKYSTYIFSCKIPEPINIDDIQEWILTDGSNSAILQATYRIPKEDSISAYNYDYSICVPFLHGSVYRGKHFIEFAELNKLLGAQRITIYTHQNSLAKSLQKALDHYTKERLIEVIEYDLPIKDIWYHGQLVTITDCLYSIGVTRFLSFHDLDEFIIPTSMHNLTALFFEIFKGDIASYRIPTRYFQLEEDVPITLNNKKSLKRLDPLYTKCVVRPEMIFEQGIHHTSRVIQDRYHCEALAASLATLHHYKKNISIADRTNDNIERFRRQLNKSYHLALQRIDLLEQSS